MINKKTNSGFTIVELLVTIIVISILAAITSVAYNSVRNNSYDSDREMKAGVIAEALERNYQKNGEYPSCSQLIQDSDAVVKDTLQGVDKKSLTTPRGEENSNSISCNPTDINNTALDKYVYIGNGGSNCSTSNACLNFTLKYRQSDGSIKEIVSRGSSVVASNSAPVLTMTGRTANSISLSWTPTSGATSYGLRYSANSSLSGSTNVSLSGSTTTYTLSNLGANTTLYFGVLPINPMNNGALSNIVMASTSMSSPVAPNITASISGANAVATSAVAICSAGTPEYQFMSRGSTSNSMPAWSAWSAWGTGITRTVPASQGWKYEFQAQVRCNNGGSYSPSASTNIASTVRSIDKPSAPTVSASTGATITTYTASVTACPAGTTAYYRDYSSTDGNGYNDTWSADSATYSVSRNTSYQGYQYTRTFQTRCFSTHTTSPWSDSGSVSHIRPVEPPSSVVWHFTRGKDSANDDMVTIAPTITCHSSVSPFGDIIQASIDRPWASSSIPNNGNTGWWKTPGGWEASPPNWRYANVYNPSTEFHANNGQLIRSTDRFRGRVLAKCRNTSTARTSSGVQDTSVVWAWGTGNI